MEKASDAGNSHVLCQVIRSTGQKKAGVSETICEKDGTTIHSLNRHLERLAERFKEQFSWSLLTQPLEKASRSKWNIDTNPPSATEIQCEISILKRDKTLGSAGLHPTLFRKGGEVVVNSLSTIVQKIWNENNASRMELLDRHPGFQKGHENVM
ncbi:ATP-binding cassette transporter [Clonorchis sinensis]|uniref:ATP-binding cassette transporter n=1 Tax=Clonorchis sinensis TaxID=79923 RepID=H2KUX5_CLOSI|nr:ATP-binding cassette transporter [Clonorchis sinensis]